VAGVLTDCGNGFGNNYGYGYSNSSGSGYGNDYGYGSGYGSGSGYGDDYGYGSGYGYGYASGVVLGSVVGHAVELLTPWNVIKIGCQIMSLDDWKTEWKNVANKHKMIVDKLVVESLIEKAMGRVGE
jgi:hypothetical protein